MCDLVCDSNVFYDIARVSIDVADLTANGTRKLLASPMTIVEILSRVDAVSFADRKSAAESLRDNANVIPNVEYELANAFGIADLSAKSTTWYDFLLELCNANTYSDYCFQIDTMGQKFETVDMDVLGLPGGQAEQIDHKFFGEFRNLHQIQFVNAIRNAIEQVCPGYLKRLKKNKVGVAQADRRGCSSKIASSAFMDALFERQQQRALISPFVDLSKAPNVVNPSISANARTNLDCYMKMYREFLSHLVNGKRGVHENDFGDLEFFLHIVPGRAFATTEAKWKTLAIDAGVGNLIIVPKQI